MLHQLHYDTCGHFYFQFLEAVKAKKNLYADKKYLQALTKFEMIIPGHIVQNEYSQKL